MDWTTASDEELIVNSLTMWANWIQTGSLVRSASDPVPFGKKLNALDNYQMELVRRLRSLASILSTTINTHKGE